MRLSDFESLIGRQAAEIPQEFLEGVAEIVVSSRTVPHPEREGVWTLGECIPLPGDDGHPQHVQSRVVLYHGSFQALARETTGFDWADEAWETLTHEIRHHVEWRARALDLEAFDRAAEANFARGDGEAFDPTFYRDGVRLQDGSFQVDDDVFIERLVAEPPREVTIRWRGEEYRVPVPEAVSLPAFLTVEGTDDPPAGELVLVLQRKGAWKGLFRRPAIFQEVVEASKLPVNQ